MQDVERGARGLGAVVAEDAVAEDRRVLHLCEVLDRDAAAAGARIVVGDLDRLDRRIGPRVNLDAAAVGIEERRLAQVVGLDRRLVAGAGREVLRAGDLEAAKHGLAGDAVAEIDDVVDDGGKARRARSASSGLAAVRMTSPTASSVMPSCRALNQISAWPSRRTIGAGVNEDLLVARSFAAASSASWMRPPGCT